MGTPLYTTDIIPMTSRPTLNVMDDGDYFVILDTSTGKISKILKTLAMEALKISYDNTSGLTAETVQAALDELVVNLGSSDSAILALSGRLDTLEGTGEGSVEKAIDDAVSPLEEDISELSNIVETTTLEPRELIIGRNFNGYGVEVGDIFNPSDMTPNDGIAAANVSVQSGETYKINAIGNKWALRCYIITNESHIVTRTTTTSSFNGEITIEDGEKTLYATFANYDSSVHGIWLVKHKTLKDSVDELYEIVEKIDSFDFGETKKAESTIYTDKCYNLMGFNVGDFYTSDRANSIGNACQLIPVKESTTYYLYGVGNEYSLRFFAVLDPYNKILDIENSSIDYRENPRLVIPPKGADRIIVNYKNYNSETDFTCIKKVKTIEGLFDLVYKPLNGKTILLLGDSILGNDRKNGIKDFLANMTGATVINGAVGGTRLCGTTRGSSAYTPFDGENLVHAIVSGDWTEQDANKDSVTWYVASQTLPDLQAMDIMNVDIVIMNWMANDYTSNTTKQQYQSAYQNVIEMLLTKNPKLRIISATMEWFTTSDGDTDTTSLYTIGTGYDACDCTIEIAERMHIPVVDMYRNMPLGQLTKATYMDTDYVHLNSLGNKVYAELLYGKMKSLM